MSGNILAADVFGQPLPPDLIPPFQEEILEHPEMDEVRELAGSLWAGLRKARGAAQGAAQGE
jgi:hypothetical protein